ncbi:hypothetical protein [Ereboglobus luteus]|uniref:hypothetical protein n=1 Tax=Ereboglobus luteus TaxID=1796921 RepID=UPI001F3E4D68|nr:hypothetical protein [Ereboglobus luteus]
MIKIIIPSPISRTGTNSKTGLARHTSAARQGTRTLFISQNMNTSQADVLPIAATQGEVIAPIKACSVNASPAHKSRAAANTAKIKATTWFSAIKHSIHLRNTMTARPLE